MSPKFMFLGGQNKADPANSQVGGLTWPSWAGSLPSWGRNLEGLVRHLSDLRCLLCSSYGTAVASPLPWPCPPPLTQSLNIPSYLQS